jgi:hypothetical protein
LHGTPLQTAFALAPDDERAPDALISLALDDVITHLLDALDPKREEEERVGERDVHVLVQDQNRQLDGAVQLHVVHCSGGKTLHYGGKPIGPMAENFMITVILFTNP